MQLGDSGIDRADHALGELERNRFGRERDRVPAQENILLIETPAPRRALRNARRIASLLLASAALLGAAACSKTPDGPGGPGRAAPKAALALPVPQASAPEVAGAMRIPASPADNSGAAVLPRKPSRIWI